MKQIANVSSQNPREQFELLEKIGSGTYGDVKYFNEVCETS